MNNKIKIRRKETSGAPTIEQLLTGEMCLVVPDNVVYIKKDSENIIVVGFADMLKSVYDSNNNGNVDTADNALSLGGIPAANYTTAEQVTAQITALINSAPGVLNTLSELANALGNDPNFAAVITNALALKLDGDSIIDGGTF